MAAPTMVPHAEIYPNPNQPRKAFDETYIADLARSIFQTGGLVQAVRLVPRPSAADSTKKYMLVAGECRWRAFALLLSTLRSGSVEELAVLGVTSPVSWWPSSEPRDDVANVRRVGLERFGEMAATVTEMSDSEIEDAAIIENLVRRNISPMEEARAFQRRLDQLAVEFPEEPPGKIVDRLAQRLGLKQAWRITERTDLLRLTSEMQDAFMRQLITPSQATEMAKLRAAHQRVLFEAIRDGRCSTFAQLRVMAQALLTSDSVPLEMFSVRTASGAATSTFDVHPDHAPVYARPPIVVPTQEDIDRTTALETKITAVCEILRAGFDGNEVVVLRRVNVAHADVLAEKLALIQASLKKMELDLRAAALVDRARAAETHIPMLSASSAA